MKKNNLWTIGAVALLVVIGVFLLAYKSSGRRAMPGDGPGPAPDLVLPDISGKTVHLSDFKGKVVLLDFWATWCMPCVQEMPELKAFYRKYKDRGFTIIGVSMDDEGKEAVGAFMRKTGEIPYPILLANGDPGPDFPINALPYSYLLDRKGRIVQEYIGFKFMDEVEKDVIPLLKEKS